MVTVTDDSGRVLGHAARVLDLSNPGEPDPVTIIPLGPGESLIRSPWQPVRIGHVFGSVLDPGTAICTDGRVIPPQHASYIDSRCRSCDGGLVVLPYQEAGITWFVVEHDRGCPAMAAWIRSQR